MTIWLLAIDRDYCSYEELKHRKVVAQGWSKIGDLSPLLPVKNNKKFREIVTNYVSYVYDGRDDNRDPGRIMMNLVTMKKGDYIICCEGKTVRGIAMLSRDVRYSYQNPAMVHNKDNSYECLYEYAHIMYPVTDWKDTKNFNHGIRLKSMGPVGIQKYGGDVDIPKLFENL